MNRLRRALRRSRRSWSSVKPRYDLIPVRPLDDVGRVLAFGAEKYDDRDWENGLPQSKLYAAAMRHLTAYWRGEDLDPESGLPHIAHATARLLMLGEQAGSTRYDHLDDRP